MQMTNTGCVALPIDECLSYAGRPEVSIQTYTGPERMQRHNDCSCVTVCAAKFVPLEGMCLPEHHLEVADDGPRAEDGLGQLPLVCSTCLVVLCEILQACLQAAACRLCGLCAANMLRVSLRC